MGGAVWGLRSRNEEVQQRVIYTYTVLGVCSSILCSAVSFSGSVHEAHTELRFCDSLYEYS